MAKKQRAKLGAFVKIPFGDGIHGYGRILTAPLFAFYDVKTDQDLSIADIESKPVLFKLWVMRRAITSGRWEIIGVAPLEVELRNEPRFYKQDPINGKIGIYHQGHEIPATREECDGLECAAVWDAEHVEDRLKDHYEGNPNKWVESMRIRVP
jgi:hypothetical protein